MSLRISIEQNTAWYREVLWWPLEKCWGSLPLLGSPKAASSKVRNMTYIGFRRKLRISIPCFGPHIEASSRQGSSYSTHGRPKQQHVSIHYKVVSQVANVRPRPWFRFRSNEAQWTVRLINSGYITVVYWGFCGFPRAEYQKRVHKWGIFQDYCPCELS